MTACTVPMAALAACAPFMGVTDPRAYLNSLLLQAAQDGTRLVATDGSALMIVRIDGDGNRWTGPDTIIPRDLVSWALRRKGARSVMIMRDGDTVTFQVLGAAFSLIATATATVINATYPNWKRAFPSNPTVDAKAGFDATLIGRVAKAASDARKVSGLRGLPNGPAVTLEPAGERGARFSFELPHGMTARGILMPLRGGAVPLDMAAVL